MEVMARILLCSTWMRRLWTLQEGLEARERLYFLFLDRAINVQTISRTLLVGRKFPILLAPIASDLFARWYMWFDFDIPDMATRTRDKFYQALDKVLGTSVSDVWLEPWHRVSVNWNNVGNRATSKEGDRSVIFCNIVHLDPKRILEIDDKTPGITLDRVAAERMRVFYKMIGQFDPSIVFSDGRRYQDDGWRWALESRAPHEGWTFEMDAGAGPGNITDQGLLANYIGFIADIEGAPNRSSFSGWEFGNNSGFWLQTKRLVSDGVRMDLQMGRVLLLTIEEYTPEPQPWSQSVLTRIGVLFKMSEDRFLDMVFGNGIPRFRRACIVSIDREEDGVAYAKYEFLASVSRPSNAQTIEYHAGKARVNCGEWRRHRKWCIG